MRWICFFGVFIACFVGRLEAVEVAINNDFRLVGIIADGQNPLEKSIIVLKNMRLNKTFTIMGQEKIPGTDLVFKKQLRNHILVGNGSLTHRINYIERQKVDGIAEINSIDQLDADAIIIKSNLAWERLEQRMENSAISMLKAPRATETECEDDCESQAATEAEPPESLPDEDWQNVSEDSMMP